MTDFSDIRIAFGESDEYSFVFDKSTKLYGKSNTHTSISTCTHLLPQETHYFLLFLLNYFFPRFFFPPPGRRESKLVSLITSSFTGNYIRNWSKFLPDVPLQSTPLFDGRAVCYPTDQILRDYLSWRQADTHINCQYNTCYWALIGSGKSPAEAQETLKVKLSFLCDELM